MEEEPSASGGITSHTAQELQDDADVIAANRQPEEAKQLDLNDNQKRWLVIGICLHSVLSPALRKYVDAILKVLYKELNTSKKIETQVYPHQLKEYPDKGVSLNYQAVNNNEQISGENKRKHYDYKIKNAVDLSKLFLKTYMAQYSKFDQSCDPAALLGLIINIEKFKAHKKNADNVLSYVRHHWAHCDLTKWNATKYANSVQMMKKLVKDLKLEPNEEKLTIEEMEKWEKNGTLFLSGGTHDPELVNAFFEQTHSIAEYMKSLKKTDYHLERIKDVLLEFTDIFHELAKLPKVLKTIETDMKKGFTSIHEKLVAQDQNKKKHGTNIGLHNLQINDWKEQELGFVETPVVKKISQILESENKVLIVGEPGIGKSMLMHHIALQLHIKSKYSIIPCSGIQDIDNLYEENEKQMFVLDDICGKCTVSLEDIEYIQNNEHVLKLMMQKGKTIVAATCRLDIFNDNKFYASCSFFKPCIFNLSSEYLMEDKLNIGKQYLTDTNIQCLKDQNESFTPLMCFLYSKLKLKTENLNLHDFLHSPYKTYEYEWENIKSRDRPKYCALFLLVLLNGTITEASFDVYNENNTIDAKVLNIVFDICKVGRTPSVTEMKEYFDCFIGTYLQKTGNEYRVIHDHIFDFLCHYFGNQDNLVTCILRHAAIQVFNERTQLTSINEQDRKYTILILEKFENEYLERIKKDLQLGKLDQTFCNAHMKHQQYRNKFLEVLESIDINDVINDQTLIQKIFITSCFRGYYDIVKHFILKSVDLNKGDLYNTPLTAACKGGNEKIVQLLIDKGCDVDLESNIGQVPLVGACGRGHEKIAMILISKRCDVNKSDVMGLNSLTAACGSGHEKIVQILINGGCDVNQEDDSGLTPLTAACSRESESRVHFSVKEERDAYQAYSTGQTYQTAAASDTKERIVKLLISNGVDVNQIDGYGDTPLTAACSDGNKKIVQLLIDKGVGLNIINDLEHTPLVAACSKGNENIVRLLIDNGCDVNQVDGGGETPLTAACQGGHYKIVRLLIDKEGNINQAADYDEKTPLTAACEGGNEQIVQLLIDKGCGVNQVDGKRDTPLLAACTNGNEKIVQLLIDKGCDVNKAGFMGNTPLLAACSNGNEKIVQLLLEKGCDVYKESNFGETHLIAACTAGNEKIVQLLLDAECDVNQVGYNTSTPLLAVCIEGNDNVLQLLIDKGCDVHWDGNMMESPLTAACKRGYEKIVQLLIDKGCDVNKADDMKKTPLVAACLKGKEKIVKLLVEQGCDANQAGDMRRTTPLVAASTEGNEQIIRFLIDNGCDVNQNNYETRSPLTAACAEEHEKIVQLLINKGCYVNQVDGLMKTPLTVSCRNGSKKVVELLIKNKCDVNQADSEDYTPLTAACYGGHEEIVQCLIDNRCDVKQAVSTEYTPLTAACRRGNLTLVQLLIDNGCDIDEVDLMGDKPLTAARENRHDHITQLLEDKMYDVTKVNS